MTTRTLHTQADIAPLARFLEAQTTWPIRVTIAQGDASRTQAQNKTVHLWFGEIARAFGDRTAVEVKAECNLTYGRPILARDDEEWNSAFGYIFDSLSLPAKLKAIRVLDIPFTRKMGVKQLSEYMEQMRRDYVEMGVHLTDPEARRYEQWQQGERQ
jgi:hypothetical protein